MKITAIVLSSLVTAAFAAAEPASFKDFDLFNADDVINAKVIISAEADANSKKSVPSSRSFLGGRRSAGNATENSGDAGSRCNGEDDCMDELSCMAGFCLPSSESCYAGALSDFNENFDSEEWLASVFQQANTTQEDLTATAIAADGFQDFQESVLFKALMYAAEGSIPDQAYDLKAAIAVCDADNAREAANPDATAIEDAPTTSGTIVYIGLHVELSAAVDLAFSAFWVLGDVPAPQAWVRGTFGVEAGAGVEVSFLVGLAFTSTPSDIEGAAIIADADAGFGPHVGGAIVINLNGLLSLELTIGLGAGGGLGLGYGIARPLNPAGKWILAAENESCDLACTNARLPPCNAGQQNAVDSATKMRFVASQVDSSCFTATECSSTGDDGVCPATTGNSCVYPIASNPSDCTSAPSDASNILRICCCSADDERCPVS